MRLDRVVAVKVLREHLADRPDRRVRFDREARAISKLNHPNICTLYDVGHDSGIDYLIVEYLDGQTLADRLKKGALPTELAIAIAIDIAAALDAAHRAGIIHRDLKPANVMLTKNGAKLLDFGIAREMPKEPLTATLTSRTITLHGTLLGTPQYMAPEQLEGREVDTRTDIFAFGALLYEMLSGRRAFPGDTQASVIGSVLERDPQPLVDTPMPLERLVRKCLAKDSDTRWQSARDLRDALAWMSDGSEQVPFARPNRNNWKAAAGAAATVVVLGAAFFVLAFRWWPSARSSRSAAPIRFEIAESGKMRFFYGAAMTLSPDGRWVVFPAVGADGVSRYWVRSLDSVDARPLPGTESARTPAAWSFDSRSVIFTTVKNQSLSRVNIDGGPPQPITDVVWGVLNGGTSTADGVLLYGLAPSSNTPSNVQNRTLFRVPLTGGVPVPVTAIAGGEIRHAWPQFLPDGHHFLYSRVASDPRKSGVYVGSIERKPEEQDRTRLLTTNRQAYFAAAPGSRTGWIVFLRDTALMAQAFDPATLKLTGEASSIAEGVDSFANAQFGLFSVSDSGALAYRQGGGGKQVLTAFEQSGRLVATFGEPSEYRHPAMSPDGRRLAVSGGLQNAQNIWTIDVERGTVSRLTFSENDFSPVWSPDGQTVAYASTRNGQTWTYIKSADGSGDEKLATDTPATPTSWSADGRFILLQITSPQTGLDVWALPDPRTVDKVVPVPMLTTSFDEYGAEVSPDGQWITYLSNESGSGVPDVYVRPFSPEGHGSTAKWQVSNGGGFAPHWGRDGRQLFYVRGTNLADAVATDVDVTSGFRTDTPRRLFTVPPIINTGAIGFARSSNRFLFVTRPNPGSEAPFTIALNWQAALKSGDQ
jgi:serine/threonine protein kinase